MSRIEEINTNLDTAYREYSELASGSDHPESLGDARSRSDRLQDLEMRIDYYRTLRTALGVIGAQRFFGTAKWSQRWGERTTSALEALYGGLDQHSLMLNGYVRVDRAFAASLNMTALPWGSAGGKVVVPFSEFVVAATAGGYWRDDEQGGSGYAGLLWQRDGGDFGLGGIIGYSNRTSTFGDEGDSFSTGSQRIEGMILGWHPAGDARMQEYIVLSREWGSNFFDMETVPESELSSWRAGLGTRVDWVDRRGTSWRGFLDAIYRNTQHDSEEIAVPVVPELVPGRGFSRDVFSTRLGFEASPRDELTLRLMFNLQHLQDDWSQEGEAFQLERTTAGAMFYFRWDF